MTQSPRRPHPCNLSLLGAGVLRVCVLLVAGSWRGARTPGGRAGAEKNGSAADAMLLAASAARGAGVADFLDYDQRRLDTQMRRLRRKVEEACGLQFPVTTLRGIGYHFYDEIDVGQ
jgi:hypothetical protein